MDSEELYASIDMPRVGLALGATSADLQLSMYSFGLDFGFSWPNDTNAVVTIPNSMFDDEEDHTDRAIRLLTRAMHEKMTMLH